MADLYRLHHITLHWSYPKRLDDIDTSWKSHENGIYYISRKFGGVESPIYIGETKRDFITRINEHYKCVSDFFNKRGEKYIRLGTIVKPQSLKSYESTEIKHLLLTIESELVDELYRLNNANALCNKRQVSSYTPWFKLHIENIGFHGDLPREIPYRDE